MPRVLWLFELPELHGAERSLLACLAGVRAAGFDVVAAAPARGPLTEALARVHVETHPISIHDPEGRHRSPEAIQAELREIVERVRPELVHANSLAMGRISAEAITAAGVPSIAHLRDIVRVSVAGVAQLNRHTRLLAVSRATRDYHLAQGVDAARCQVLYNGIDLARFCPRSPTGDLHRELRLDSSCRLIGAIGQIGIRKGQDTLVEAFAAAAGRWNDIHLVVVGRRTSQKQEALAFEAALHERVARAGLKTRVHFLGVRNDVERLLPELSIVAHAARQEPLGRVLLEAAASGRPIVATTVGGTREIFPAVGVQALLVPPDDAVALELALDELLADAARANHLGAEARRRVEEVFDVRTAAAGLVAHYGELCGA